jgi:DNA (cytosine-5)-methyltransferase 1
VKAQDLFPRVARQPSGRRLSMVGAAAAIARIWVVLFAGGGGSSKAIKAAGEKVAVAINHSPVAIAVHEANFPETEHHTTSVWEVPPRVAAGGRRVGALWASPDCRDFSIAKGGKPRDKKIRSLAWSVIRWAKDVAPDRIFLENVREFAGWGPLLPNGKRDPKRIGKTFRAWIAKLRKYGYEVDWRVLNAADYGAPTSRKRLFLVARRDGQPIAWPKPTHGKGPGLLPYKTAADCIDWSIPTPSIFMTKAEAKKLGLRIKRPLVEKTLWRLAQGIRRFVFESPKPFILKVNHGKLEPRHEPIDEPLSTVTAGRRGHALVVPVLQQSGYGEREGQRARALQLDLPLGTVVAGGSKHALVMAFLTKYFGDPLRTDGGGGVVLGSDLDHPLGTVTTRDHHALTVATLAKFRGTSDSHPGCADIAEPMPTVTSGGNHIGLVRAFLTAYYGSDATGGQTLLEPMRTITAKARLGIVTIYGTDYQIVDIGFRMLEPHELLRAQCGEYANDYDLSAATTKEEQIELIGNMVCPHPAKALVEANPAAPEAMAA